jgi:hypothetical protein
VVNGRSWDAECSDNDAGQRSRVGSPQTHEAQAATKLPNDVTIINPSYDRILHANSSAQAFTESRGKEIQEFGELALDQIRTPTSRYNGQLY